MTGSEWDEAERGDGQGEAAPRAPRRGAKSGSMEGRAPKRKFRFESAIGLIQGQIRKASETRGFSSARVLTHWEEVAGPELAALCRPSRITYGRGGLGATLVLEVPGAAAPMLQPRLEPLRERINGVFGFGAVRHIQIQHVHSLEAGGPAQASDDDDFSLDAPALGGQAAGFARAGAAKPPRRKAPDPALIAEAQTLVQMSTSGVEDAGLKAALARLALNVLNRSQGQTKIHPEDLAAADSERKDDR